VSSPFARWFIIVHSAWTMAEEWYDGPSEPRSFEHTLQPTPLSTNDRKAGAGYSSGRELNGTVRLLVPYRKRDQHVASAGWLASNATAQG
jgi:hypothetical protein